MDHRTIFLRASGEKERAGKKSCGPPTKKSGLEGNRAGLRRKKAGWKEIVQASAK
jgi:hypothetical protein